MGRLSRFRVGAKWTTRTLVELVIMLFLRTFGLNAKDADWIGVSRTERLRLEPATNARQDTEARDRAALGELLGAVVPESWPPMVIPPPSPGAAADWATLYVVHEKADGPSTVIGLAGMARWVGGETMQFGGSLLREWQRDGLAAEFTVALADWALQQDGVLRIVCDIPEKQYAAAKCLRMAGYSETDLPTYEGFVRWERKRA